MTRRRIHYVVSTHWDREWYQTFQDYRYRLVQLLDRVLAGLADGRMAGPFTCDGQAIILEDYIEVRPERRAEVEALVAAGKLIVGPWYVMPDEFLVSGESLIRNLALGRALAREMGGEPSNAGFVCDIFGHNSQMPQLLAGFGVRAGFLWRGVNHVDTHHFLWRGADGTILPTYRFGHRGYCSFADNVRDSFGTDEPFDAEEVAEKLDAFAEAEAAITEVDPILFFDGGDHQEWDQEVYGVVSGYMARDDRPYEYVHTTLDAYLDEMLPQIDRIATLREGELREPARFGGDRDSQWLIPGVLSSRAWIKQDNVACQNLLCQWAEPWSAHAARALGREYPRGYLDVAWRWLLKNHPHDSICGCSIDQVHEDMRFRFSQCRQIGQRLTVEATRALAANVDAEIATKALRVVAFNPLPVAHDGVADLTLQIPSDWPTFNEFFGFEPKPGFRIYDADGQELPYQRIAQAMGRRKKRIRDVRFPESYRTDDVTVSLPLRVPPGGYTTLTVRPDENEWPTRHPAVPGLATSERSMENDALRVVIEPNGTLTVTDLRTDETYARLLTFEDCADIGDGWYHGVAVNEQAFVSTGARADIALVADGPQVATFRVRVHMTAPAEFAFDRMERAGWAELVIDSRVTLRAGAARVEVETTVHNAADDHRLRVLFPSGAESDVSQADGAFDVVERPIALRADNPLYRELEVETRPQQTWTAVADDARGLAIISVGQMESAVRDLPERPIALTLFRGTRRTVMTDGEPEGQLRGELTFRYWIVPLADGIDALGLCQLGQALGAGLEVAQLTAADVAQHDHGAALPPEASFLQVEGPGIVTSSRVVVDHLEVRLFNPTTADGRVTLTLAAPGGAAYTSAQPVNLESVASGPTMALFEGRITVDLGAKRILTLAFA